MRLMLITLLAMIALWGSVRAGWAQNPEVGRIDGQGDRAVLLVEAPRPVGFAALTLAKEFGIASRVEEPPAVARSGFKRLVAVWFG